MIWSDHNLGKETFYLDAIQKLNDNNNSNIDYGDEDDDNLTP
jgi:hypothetical protein